MVCIHCRFSLPTVDVRIGLVDARFTVTESVDSSILLCAELQEGCLQRNLTVAIVTVGTNGKRMASLFCHGLKSEVTLHIFILWYTATAGVDYLVTHENLTFTDGQRAFDGIMQCATVEILDDEVILFAGLPLCIKA